MQENQRTTSTAVVVTAVMITLAAAALIAGVYGKAGKMSRQAEEENQGVLICQSVTEIWLASGNEEEFLTQLKKRGYAPEAADSGYYRLQVTNDALNAYHDRNYLVEVHLDTEPTAAGVMKIIQTSFISGQEEIYRLNTQQYQPGQVKEDAHDS